MVAFCTDALTVNGRGGHGTSGDTHGSIAVCQSSFLERARRECHEKGSLSIRSIRAGPGPVEQRGLSSGVGSDQTGSSCESESERVQCRKLRIERGKMSPGYEGY